MDLTDSPEDADFRVEVSEWLESHLTDKLRALGADLSTDTELRLEWERTLGSGGWIGIDWPQEFGGPGWDAIERHLRYGGKLVGLCGGMQMLGRWIHDPQGVEGDGGSSEGLGVLDFETTLHSEKQLRNVSGVLFPGDARAADCPTCPAPR